MLLNLIDLFLIATLPLSRIEIECQIYSCVFLVDFYIISLSMFSFTVDFTLQKKTLVIEPKIGLPR